MLIFIFLAGWLLSVPLRAAQRGLRLQPGQAPGQPRLPASQRLLQKLWILMEALPKPQWEAQLSSPASRNSTTGATRTAQTSTRMTRGPASAVSLPWKDSTLICARMNGMKVYHLSRLLFLIPDQTISTLAVLSCDHRVVRELTVGRRIGFYKIRGEIGCGNFSHVKLGIHALTKGTKVQVLPLHLLKMRVNKGLNHDPRSLPSFGSQVVSTDGLLRASLCS